ncbi:MAG: efflux RND transporter periplasmic adaptor subunit [Porphyromonadaceae bacterium]|nr:efflux RND transporter periplasmic adaptor subunit [Porphyromonadaceae bacterium]
MKPINIFIYLNLMLGILSACKQSSVKDKQVEKPKQEEAEAHADPIVHITADQIKAVGIQLGPVERKELSATIRANGSLKVPKTHKGYVTTLYGGTIRQIHTLSGQYVRRGQLIATLANPQFVQIQEEYLTTLSRLTYAEQEVDRQQSLQEGGAGATKNLQNAKAELSSLKARTASLAQQIRLAGIEPSSISADNLRGTLSIVSPIDGVIGEIIGQIGSYIEPSSPIAEVIDNASLHLDLNIYEQDLPKIKVGQTIHFRLTNSPKREYDARVHTIGSTFEANSRTIAVHCDLVGDKTGFIDGMNITGVVSLGEELLPAVPDAAIVHADGKDYIFVQQDLGHDHEDEWEFVPVEVIRGTSQLGYTAITPLAELAEDAVIVLKGAFFVNARLRESDADHGHVH